MIHRRAFLSTAIGSLLAGVGLAQANLDSNLNPEPLAALPAPAVAPLIPDTILQTVITPKWKEVQRLCNLYGLRNPTPIHYHQPGTYILYSISWEVKYTVSDQLYFDVTCVWKRATQSSVYTAKYLTVAPL